MPRGSINNLNKVGHGFGSTRPNSFNLSEFRLRFKMNLKLVIGRVQSDQVESWRVGDPFYSFLIIFDLNSTQIYWILKIKSKPLFWGMAVPIRCQTYGHHKFCVRLSNNECILYMDQKINFLYYNINNWLIYYEIYRDH